MRLKRHGKSLARALLHQAGLLHGARFMNRESARILMYHDFPTLPGIEESLDEQCRHIAKYYDVVTLDDVADFLRRGKALSANAIVITIDDGNRDFLVNGYPVFRANKIPVTVFLVSGFLDKQLWLWWDQLAFVIENAKQKSFEIPLRPGQLPTAFSLETESQRVQTIGTLTLSMKDVDPSERADIIANTLGHMLGVDLPEQPPTAMAPMTWDEVRTVSKAGVSFGAHTVTHPVLSRVKDLKNLETEILESKKRIESEIGTPVAHFCYPYGHWGDFNDATLDVVGRCGFETASTAEHGLIHADTPPYQLTRLSVDPTTPKFYFKERLAGLHDG